MREKDYYGAIKGFCLKWNLPEVWNSDRITGANLIYEVIKVINAMINELREYEDRVDGKLEDMLKMIEDFLKMFNEDLSETVLNILLEWKDSGELEEIINDALFNQKLDKSVFESFKETYDQTIENIEGEINKNKDDIIQNKLDAKKDNDDLEESLKSLVSSYFVSVKEHGAIGNGIADDTEALQYCLDNFDSLYIPNGTYIITKPLLLTKERGQKIIGESNFNTVIKKNGEGVWEGLEPHPNRPLITYNNIDAIFMTYGYIGDITIKNMRIMGKGTNDFTKYGFYMPQTFRMLFEDLYTEDIYNSFLFLQSWNTNMKKVRMIRGYKGIQVGDNTNSNVQSTSFNFDNTFVEKHAIAYHFSNLTYFSGSSMSSDFIDECAFWFEWSSGAINGWGNELSKGQLIRSWLSYINMSGGFILGVKNNQGLLPNAKSKAKIEIYSENRNDTGLTLDGFECRSHDSSSTNGDSSLYYLYGSVTLVLINFREGNLLNVTDGENFINNSGYDCLIRMGGSRKITINGKKVLTE